MSNPTIVNWCKDDACDPCKVPTANPPGTGGGPGTGLPAFTAAVYHIIQEQDLWFGEDPAPDQIAHEVLGSMVYETGLPPAGGFGNFLGVAAPEQTRCYYVSFIQILAPFQATGSYNGSLPTISETSDPPTVDGITLTTGTAGQAAAIAQAKAVMNLP